MPDDSKGGVPVADDGSHAGPPGGSNPVAASLPSTPVPDHARRNASVVLATTGFTDTFVVPAASSGLDHDIEITAGGTALTKKAADAARDAAARSGIALREIEES